MVEEIEYNLTKKDLEIFLTDWELEFLTAIEIYKRTGEKITRKQNMKLDEINSKLQEIEDDIKTVLENRAVSVKVVNNSIKPRPINLSYFINLKSDDLRFTILSDAQKEAIKNIKKYWQNRVKNYNNWKNQKHFSYKKETISSRIDEKLFNELRDNNTQKLIQNFVRTFLRDIAFRIDFLEKIEEQYKKDVHSPVFGVFDPTEQYNLLIAIFPKVVSGKLYSIEKELLTLFFTFFTEYTISYAIRVALIHFQDLPNQTPIKKCEIIPILYNLITNHDELDFE